MAKRAIIGSKWVGDNLVMTFSSEKDWNGKEFHYETSYNKKANRFSCKAVYPDREEACSLIGNPRTLSIEHCVSKGLIFPTKHKVVISQAGKDVTFTLSDKELRSLRISSVFTDREKASKATYGRCYNFAMWAFFDCDTTRAKAGRFASNFDYHKGDFMWRLED